MAATNDEPLMEDAKLALGIGEEALKKREQWRLEQKQTMARFYASESKSKAEGDEHDRKAEEDWNQAIKRKMRDMGLGLDGAQQQEVIGHVNEYVKTSLAAMMPDLFAEARTSPQAQEKAIRQAVEADRKAFGAYLRKSLKVMGKDADNDQSVAAEIDKAAAQNEDRAKERFYRLGAFDVRLMTMKAGFHEEAGLRAGDGVLRDVTGNPSESLAATKEKYERYNQFWAEAKTAEGGKFKEYLNFVECEHRAGNDGPMCDPANKAKYAAVATEFKTWAGEKLVAAGMVSRDKLKPQAPLSAVETPVGGKAGDMGTVDPKRLRTVVERMAVPGVPAANTDPMAEGVIRPTVPMNAPRGNERLTPGG